MYNITALKGVGGKRAKLKNSVLTENCKGEDKKNYI